MYGDIADNPRNLFPGKLFNNWNYTDVYKGAPIDYTHEEVTVDLVLAVLTGDKTKVKDLTGREGKVIDSGPDDNVFVAVSDHSGPGTLLFPDRFMNAKELHKALEDMHDNKKFAKLVFYLESFYSGFMFMNLAKDLNIYALTASDEAHGAAMNYCNDPDFPKNCLGG